MKVALVGLLGAAGALARYGITTVVGERDLPVATLGINVVGSFLLGLLVAWGSPKVAPAVATGLGVGFLGAFTTFSTFAVETRLLDRPAATAYVVLTVALGIAAAFAGVGVGRSLAG